MYCTAGHARTGDSVLKRVCAWCKLDMGTVPSESHSEDSVTHGMCKVCANKTISAGVEIALMRLWTLHPEYLDPRGLVALWREALLAQAVLKGQTRGYTHHPQLIRFRESPSPLDSIAAYLRGIQAEATRRGYHFDVGKIESGGHVDPIKVTQGQLDYEFAHLKAKLRRRSASWLATFESVSAPKPHPLFRIIPGSVAAWEVIPGR